jgi:hypothetical protein
MPPPIRISWVQIEELGRNIEGSHRELGEFGREIGEFVRESFIEL